MGNQTSLTGLNGTALYTASYNNQEKMEEYVATHGFDYVESVH